MAIHGTGFDRKPGSKHFPIVFLPNEKTLSRAYVAIGEFMKGRYR
jgi:hypothetical protein